MRSIQRRLTKLEGLLPSPPTKRDPVAAQLLLLTILGVAYHFGDPRPDEGPATAFARALGYRSFEEFRDGIKDAWARHKAVQQRLFAKFNMSLEDLSEQGTENFIDGLERIADSLPERYHECFAAGAAKFGPLPPEEGDVEQNSSEA
jgi:hypothetical protein